MKRTYRSISKHVVVCLGRVDLGEEEASLRTTMLCVYVARHGEPSVQNVLSVINWILKELLEIGIFRLILVTRSAPLSNRLKWNNLNQD